MRYPFLFQKIGEIDLSRFREDLNIFSKQKIEVTANWHFTLIQSPYLENYIKENFYGMEIVDGLIYLSHALDCLFHIDTQHRNFMTHRVLIPLDSNFTYEWFVNEKLYRYRPKIKEVLLFNNLVPHRFVRDENLPPNQKRLVIFFNLYDPNSAEYLSTFEKIHEGNSELDREIKAKLGENG